MMLYDISVPSIFCFAESVIRVIKYMHIFTKSMCTCSVIKKSVGRNLKFVIETGPLNRTVEIKNKIFEVKTDSCVY